MKPYSQEELAKIEIGRADTLLNELKRMLIEYRRLEEAWITACQIIGTAEHTIEGFLRDLRLLVHEKRDSLLDEIASLKEEANEDEDIMCNLRADRDALVVERKSLLNEVKKLKEELKALKGQ